MGCRRIVALLLKRDDSKQRFGVRLTRPSAEDLAAKGPSLGQATSPVGLPGAAHGLLEIERERIPLATSRLPCRTCLVLNQPARSSGIVIMDHLIGCPRGGRRIVSYSGAIRFGRLQPPSFSRN
jgi:hypothetical protein